MARRLSRRAVATFVAEQLRAGDMSVIKQLAAYLISTRQTRMAQLFVRDIEASLAKKRHLFADVTTAFDMTVEIKKQIQTYLTKETGATAVTLRERVDPDVLGGVRVHIPGHEIDTTVQRQLTVLRTSFKKA